jgi:DNA-binding CsgD family transcriptional regulator
MVEQSLTADSRLRVRARSTESNLLCMTGDPSRIDELREGAHSELRRHGSGLAWTCGIVISYVTVAAAYERFEDIDSLALPLMADAKSSGAILAYQGLLVARCEALWRLGRLGEARIMASEGAELAELMPTVAPFAWIALANLCHEQGDAAECKHWVEKVEASSSRSWDSPYIRLWLCLFACRDHLGDGRADAAARIADQTQEIARVSGVVEPCVVPWHGAALDAYIAAGRPEKADLLIEWLAEICKRLPCHSPRAVVARAAATVAWLRGELDTAESGFETALAHNSAVPMPLSSAETLIAYGRFLRQTGRVSRARSALHDAVSILEPTGAGRLQKIAHDELAAAGGRRRASRSDQQITAREQQVARLAARGLTNTEIGRALYITPKTVDHHLSRVYTKLGITSRRDLIRTWRDTSTSDGTDRGE